jgi:hypothetical protein
MGKQEYMDFKDALMLEMMEHAPETLLLAEEYTTVNNEFASNQPSA